VASRPAYVQANEIVPVPSALFGPLLERMGDVQEIRCALRVIFLLHRKQGTLKYISAAELVADPVLQYGDGVEALGSVLKGFVAYGLLLKVATDAENGDSYCLDTPSNRRALDRAGKGELNIPKRPVAKPQEEATTRPDIFVLYEDNIGAIYPMAAERLKDMETEYPEDWIAEAFREAVLQNSRNLKYIEAILRRWRDDGRGAREPEGRTGTVSASEVFRRAGR